MNYLYIIEQGDDGSFTGYVPDLPGCVSCGDTIEEVRVMIREAIAVHIESLREFGEPVPPPTSRAETVAA